MELMKITHHYYWLVKNDWFFLFFLFRVVPLPLTRRAPSLPHPVPISSCLRMLLLAAATAVALLASGAEARQTLCCGCTSSATACCPWGSWPREAAHGVRPRHDPCGAAGKQVACGAVPTASSSSAQFPLLPRHARAKRLRMPIALGAFKCLVGNSYFLLYLVRI
jgi:hypothetical protein